MDGEYRAMMVRVTGRVQGVGFREWTRRQAGLLGVSGWVRNEPDRSVAALLAGSESATAAMIALLWKGPESASVADVRSEPIVIAEMPTGFRVLRS